MELYIWGRKEIENDFIIPTVIARVVCARAPEHNVENISRTVEDRIHQIVTALRDIVFDGFATRFRDRNPKGNVAEANRQTRELLEGMFHDPESALACVSGKEVLRQLSASAPTKSTDAVYHYGTSYVRYGQQKSQQKFRRLSLQSNTHALLKGLPSSL